MTIKLQTHSAFHLSVLNTSIASNNDARHGKLETGMRVEILHTTALYLLVQNCSIFGNHHGIDITADENSTLNLKIDQCSITNNGYNTEQKPETGKEQVSGGVMVSISKSSNAVVIANFTSSNLSNNTDTQVAFTSHSGTITVTVMNCTLRGQSLSGHGALFIGVKNCLWIGLFKSRIEANLVGVSLEIGTCSFKMMVEKTVIEKNQNGLLIRPLNNIDFADGSLAIKDTTFKENNGVSLGVSYLRPISCSSPLSDIYVNNVTFFNNTNFVPSGGIVQMNGGINLIIQDSCVFRANRGTPVRVLTTWLTLSGEVIFEDNIAVRGGAISMSYSELKLESINNRNVNISFLNNTATIAGGAIYIDQSLSMSIDPATTSSCFYEIERVSVDDFLNSVVNLTLAFSNNTATDGGLDLFGATPNSFCEVKFVYKKKIYKYGTSSNIKDLIFKTSSSLSSVTSDPKRVCLCDSSSKLMCANLSYIFYETTSYPGEVFLLPLAVVGFDFGTVTGPVYASLLPQTNNSNSSLGNGQHVRQVDYQGCTHLEFTVNSLNPMETIVLTINDTIITKVAKPSDISYFINLFQKNHVIHFPLLVVPVYIDVTLLDCPSGFELTESGRCNCIFALKEMGINNCSI